jgi:hypothetical protein
MLAQTQVQLPSDARSDQQLKLVKRIVVRTNSVFQLLDMLKNSVFQLLNMLGSDRIQFEPGSICAV